MNARQYCCCAIPLLRAGIYAVLGEQVILAFTVGVLALATPHIVGAASPSFAPAILAAICFGVAALQVLGFLAVAREKTSLYRRYSQLHFILILAAFAVSAAWIIISATKHSTAISKCETDFFSDDLGGSSISGEGQTLCNIFTWVDVGLMGGLWLVLAIAQTYFYIVVTSFGASQRYDHKKYDSLYNNNFNSDIPLTSQHADPWDARASIEEERSGNGYGHLRQQSSASVSTILGEKQQRPRSYGNSYSDVPASYPPQGQDYGYPKRQASGDEAQLPQPSYAYTQNPAPTPQYYDNYHSSGSNGLEQPGRSQAHPAEGSFGRRTPRFQKPGSADYHGYSYFPR